MNILITMLIIGLLINTHMVAYHFGAIRAYNKLDKELTKIKDELTGRG